MEELHGESSEAEEEPPLSDHSSDEEINEPAATIDQLKLGSYVLVNNSTKKSAIY